MALAEPLRRCGDARHIRGARLPGLQRRVEGEAAERRTATSRGGSDKLTRIEVRYAAWNLGSVHPVDQRTGHLIPLLAYRREPQHRHGAAVLVVHHARKAAGNARARQALRGSSDRSN